jgi:RNA polymerase sigma factor (sigma-70 family)
VSPEEEYDEEVAALYRKSARKVQTFLCSMGCDRGLAEEITDDAFLGARRRWAHVRSLEQPEGYVFVIARNERRRRQKKHDDQARDLHPDLQGTAWEVGYDPAQQVADSAAIRQALRRLPPTQREAVCLRHIADLSEAGTAEIMKVSVGAVKRYASEGRQALRELLAEFRGRRGGIDR